MCAWYTGEFVKYRVLPTDGRIPWGQMSDQHKALVDLDRSRNEIALVDLKGGKTLYGIDAMFALTGTWIPLLKLVLNFPGFKGVMNWVYKTISYNRRMMVGGKPASHSTSCEPDFHLTWRLIYLVSSLLVGAAAWYGVGNHIFREESGGWQLLTFTGIGWMAMFAATMILPFRLRMEYLGNLATLLNISTLMFAPGLWLISLAGKNLSGLMFMNVLIVFIAMYLFHERRIANLGLHHRWQWVWLVTSMSSFVAWAIYYGSVNP